MRVLFDYQAFEFQSIGGVSRSYAELIGNLPEEGVSCKVGIRESDNVYLREKHLVDRIRPLHYTHNLLFEGKKYFRGQRTITRKAMEVFGHKNDCWQVNQEYCIRLLKQGRFDVFEPTFFDDYFLPYLNGKPFVMTVHDMIPEKFPEYFSREDMQIINKQVLCPMAAHIHVPSENTKRDLVEILNIPPEKITVIPHGSPILGVVDYKPIFNFPYLLYVGDRYGYKNFAPFIRDCAQVLKDFDIRLVCTGRTFNEDENKMFAQLGITDKVVHFFAEELQFPSLYHNAVAFAYPSLYEGFGMPILEAYTYGCPVMLNNTSCFPEVAGDAAVYFELYDGKSDFYDKFKYFYELPAEDRLELIAKGYRRNAVFSWQKSAHQLVQVYKSII